MESKILVDGKEMWDEEFRIYLRSKLGNHPIFGSILDRVVVKKVKSNTTPIKITKAKIKMLKMYVLIRNYYHNKITKYK